MLLTNGIKQVWSWSVETLKKADAAILRSIYFCVRWQYRATDTALRRGMAPTTFFAAKLNTWYAPALFLAPVLLLGSLLVPYMVLLVVQSKRSKARHSADLAKDQPLLWKFAQGEITYELLIEVYSRMRAQRVRESDPDWHTKASHVLAAISRARGSSGATVQRTKETPKETPSETEDAGSDVQAEIVALLSKLNVSEQDIGGWWGSLEQDVLVRWLAEVKPMLVNWAILPEGARASVREVSIALLRKEVARQREAAESAVRVHAEYLKEKHGLNALQPVPVDVRREVGED